MSIYMLNLMFNPTDNDETNDGRFLEYDNTQPILQQSKVWLQAKNTNPHWDHPHDWTVLEQDTRLLTLEVDDQVVIRICGGPSLSGYVGRVTTILTRDAGRASHGHDGKPFQTRGSPFPLAAGSTQSCVIFHTPTWQSQSAAGSWVQVLGAVTLTTPPPKHKPPGFHDAYNVIVALTVGPGDSVNGPTEFFIYSHDPDMDVNC